MSGCPSSYLFPSCKHNRNYSSDSTNNKLTSIGHSFQKAAEQMLCQCNKCKPDPRGQVVLQNPSSNFAPLKTLYDTNSCSQAVPNCSSMATVIYLCYCSKGQQSLQQMSSTSATANEEQDMSIPILCHRPFNQIGPIQSIRNIDWAQVSWVDGFTLDDSIERSLELKFPTIWAAEVGRGREEKESEEKKEKEQVERRSKCTKRWKSRKTPSFFRCFVGPECGKVSLLMPLKQPVRSHLAGGEIKNCMPLWREADLEVNMLKRSNRNSKNIVVRTLWKLSCWKVRATEAWSAFWSQNVKKKL